MWLLPSGGGKDSAVGVGAQYDPTCWLIQLSVSDLFASISQGCALHLSMCWPRAPLGRERGNSLLGIIPLGNGRVTLQESKHSGRPQPLGVCARASLGSATATIHCRRYTLIHTIHTGNKSVVGTNNTGHRHFHGALNSYFPQLCQTSWRRFQHENISKCKCKKAVFMLTCVHKLK